MQSDARRCIPGTPRWVARNTNPRLLLRCRDAAALDSTSHHRNAVPRLLPIRRQRWSIALVAISAVVLSLVAAGAAAQGVAQSFGGSGESLAFGRAGQIGLLGIWARPLSPGAVQLYGLGDKSAGAIVVSVAPGSAGARNGLRAGDVITAVNDLPLGTAHSLHSRIAEVMPTTEVELSLLREGKAHTLVVDLLAPPSDESLRSAIPAAAQAY